MNIDISHIDLFVPDGLPADEALSRTTHLAVAAHQDDLEIMAYQGILACFGEPDEWFCGVVVTDGAGSPRAGHYAAFDDLAMRRIRAAEQKKAAIIGEYGALVQLGYPSQAVKTPGGSGIAGGGASVARDGAASDAAGGAAADLQALIARAQPRVVYTHNLADKHETHVAVALRTIQALRGLPHSFQPEKLYGCEVWRNLDWLSDDEKIIFDVSGRPNLGMTLVEVFDSQICGGKRYDLATAGRRLANATYAVSHAADEMDAAIYAMDLTPLLDPALDIADFVDGAIARFRSQVAATIGRLQR